MPVTVYATATHILGREARNGADYEEACLPMLGGCQHCGATIAAYNAYPSRSGYLRCANCIGPDGYRTAAGAAAEIFAEDDAGQE